MIQNVLILGGSGLLGKGIINELIICKNFQVYATYFENPFVLGIERNIKLNIEDLPALDKILNALNPQIVISCLRGDFNKQLILHSEIAEYLKDTNGQLYFFSTTNVFDSDLSKAHYEDDVPSSSTDYGRYKIACEKRIVEILDDNACILRIPQVWGKDSPRMNNLLNSLHMNEKIVVYPTLFCNTNTDAQIAKQLHYIIENNLRGIFHLTAEDVVNHKDFYGKLISKLGFDNAKIQENLDEGGYFALLTNRQNEFPERLRLTNESVIDYLAN